MTTSHGSILAAVMPVALLAGCHPPDRKIYEESKACVGILDASMSVVSPMRLYRAGLNYSDVNEAAEGSFDGALKSGTNAGLDRKTMLAEIDAARAQAHAAYADANAPSQQAKFARLVAAAKDCLPKPDSGNE